MIRPLEPTDLALVETLLTLNPHKADQISFQRLDPRKMVKFHSDRLFRRAREGAAPLFLMEEMGDIGLIGVQDSSSHSSFFDKLVFSVSPVLSYNLNGLQKESLLNRVLEEADSRGGEILWIQIEEEESDWVSLLSRRGGAYCGTSLRLSCRLGQSSAPIREANSIQIRLAEEKDLEALESIVEKGHRSSHFFRDPHLREDRKSRLFPEYLRKSFGQPNRILWVAVDDQGKLAGFSLLMTPPGQEESLGRKVGILDFIVVDPEVQGQGVGHLLLDRTHRSLEERGYEYVELKTMLDNRSAIHFYQRKGYRLISSEMHFSLGIGGKV